jgi:DNA replication protein DnaC
VVEKAQAAVEAKVREIDERNRQELEQKLWVLKVNKRLSETLGARYLTYDDAAIPKREALLKATSFVITGQRGAGKSMALTYALYERAVAMWKHDVTEIEAYKAPVLFTLLHNGSYPKEDAALFAIDDLGTEYGETFALSQFGALVEFRYSHLLPMLITTNMTKVEFLNRVEWERISERLLQMCSWIVFTGGSRRGLA